MALNDVKGKGKLVESSEASWVAPENIVKSRSQPSFHNYVPIAVKNVVQKTASVQ